jgi:hypothetical protein
MTRTDAIHATLVESSSDQGFQTMNDQSPPDMSYPSKKAAVRECPVGAYEVEGITFGLVDHIALRPVIDHRDVPRLKVPQLRGQSSTPKHTQPIGLSPHQAAQP